MNPSKAEMRERLRRVRREHAAALSGGTHALLFMRPPQAVATAVPRHAVIGLYAEGRHEAPAGRYATWFAERGHPIALPWFAGPDATMAFRAWDPLAPEPLQPGPFGIRQPPLSAAECRPDLVFVPLLGFTPQGARLGQGAGHYDRWLAAHPDVVAIGLAWDCQRMESLPIEPHDRPLAAVITPTRLYGSVGGSLGLVKAR
jgi:5-formyltetrahydrofolate cyclo-ligase